MFAQPSPKGVAAYRAELKIPDGAVVALYSGNMGGKQGLEVLAELARLCGMGEPTYMPNTALAHVIPAGAATDSIAKKLEAPPTPPVVFVFCGNGAGRADLVARCQGLPNVRFIDLQPAERLPDLLATADIHLLPQRADAADLVMPSKLTGMLASARAVVATAHTGTELATVVQTCGLVVPPEDAAALAQAVRTLAQNPALDTAWVRRAMRMRRPTSTANRCCTGLRPSCCICWPKTPRGPRTPHWMKASLLLMRTGKTVCARRCPLAHTLFNLLASHQLLLKK